MDSENYEPSKMFDWWSWYRGCFTHNSHLPMKLFDLLCGGTEYEYYRRDYPTLSAALADLAQAQAALAKEQEEQTVTTKTTQGEYTWESVQVGDRVRITEDDECGNVVIESVVVRVHDKDESILLRSTGGGSWWIYKHNNKSIELVSRPPRRVEISKDDLILKTPIGTKVELVQNNGGIIHGTLWATGRTGDGLCVYLGPDRFDAAEVDLDNIKAIYTEVQDGE